MDLSKLSSLRKFFLMIGLPLSLVLPTACTSGGQAESMKDELEAEGNEAMDDAMEAGGDMKKKMKQRKKKMGKKAKGKVTKKKAKMQGKANAKKKKAKKKVDDAMGADEGDGGEE